MDAILGHMPIQNEFGYIFVTVPTTGVVVVEYEYQHSSHMESENQISGLYVGVATDPPSDPHFYTRSFYLVSLYDGIIYDAGRIRKSNKCRSIIAGNRIVVKIDYDMKNIKFVIRSKTGCHLDCGILFEDFPDNVQPCICSSYGNMDNERMRLVNITWNNQMYSNAETTPEIPNETPIQIIPRDSQTYTDPMTIANKLLNDPEVIVS